MASKAFIKGTVILHAILYLAIIPQTLTQQVETNPEVLVVKSIQSIGTAINYFTSREASVDSSELLGLRVATGERS
jgi:hypothetical protein